jgi:hypothetical protein
MGVIGSFSEKVARAVAADLLKRGERLEGVDYELLTRINALGVDAQSLKRWINAIREGQDVSADRRLKQVDAKIMGEIGGSAPIQVRARDARGSGDVAWSTTHALEERIPPKTYDGPPADLCRVWHFGESDGARQMAPKGSGTGFRLTNRLVLTCRHVLPEDVGDCKKVLFKFPVYDSEQLGHPTQTPMHLVKVYEASQSAGHVRILLESPQRGDETVEWNGAGPGAASDSLDFALLEIDDRTESRWEVRIGGSLKAIGSVNLYMLIATFERGIPPLYAPVSPPSAEELNHRGVEVRVITPELWYRSLAGGITLANDRLQRVRYTQHSTDYGDSGAPLVEVNGERATVVAIHQARTPQGGQAIPIGPILESIFHSNIDRSHKEDLRNFGWLPES